MFTGIIECLGHVKKIREYGSGIEFTIEAPFLHELKIDQSVAHNGVCLTVVDIAADSYKVIAIQETLQKTNLENLAIGNFINLERCLKMNSYLDGHLVQGHVDTTAICTNVIDCNGSWEFYFSYKKPNNQTFVTVQKGSITINGVSLTVVNSELDNFSVAIIPYTYENTNFKHLKKGDTVNLEFDIIGKYVARLMQLKE